MLAGQRINADDVTPSYRFIFNLQRRKYIQYYTTIYIGQNLRVECLTCIKIPFLGWWPMAISARCKLHSTLVPY
jgi:hypothetical protein